MDANTLRVLEFDRVLERLAAHTSNRMGREAALALAPSSFPEVVTRRLQETREARRLLEGDSGMPLGGIHDVREAVERAGIEYRLTPQELLDVAATASSARRLRIYLQKREEQCPLLAEIAANLATLPVLEGRIGEAISENAEVRDSATPELSRIRSQLKVIHARLTDRLNNIIGSERYRTFIQEPIITVREGRYCIPVKAEYRTQLGGIIHDASTSGATMFVEPGACVTMGNELKELAIKEEHEVDRILSRLTGAVGEAAAALRTTLAQLAVLDVANARALLAIEMGAADPRINYDGVVRLRKARHPLLTGEVVPIDIEVGDRFNVLLITGPNTGGKTVSLKTVGLLVLMAQCGFQIPADDHSEVALFENVYADIGDEQDIQQSLSTFSAHLRNIVRILGGIGPSALVLLDEVGAGTDPAEGAALAKALLDALQARGARVLATTHYGELKEYAYANAGVENAAVEFNRETVAPTYHVLLGVPGSSHAFYIAGRLGLPDEVVEAARGYLSAREKSTGEMLQQIEESRRRTVDAEGRAGVAALEAERLRDEYDQRVRQVADVQRTVRREAEEEMRALLRRATERAENLIDELRKMNRGSRKGTAVRQGLAALRREAAAELAEPDQEPEVPEPAGGFTFHQGDRVRITSLDREGVLLEEPREGVVAVQVGAMRVALPVDQLRPPRPQDARAAARERSNASQISMAKAVHVAPELNIRAMRVEEAMPLLDKYIDDAYAAGLKQVRIVHGKGTGALRRFVKEFLTGHAVVHSLRPGEDGEGGDGVTVVALKE